MAASAVVKLLLLACFLAPRAATGRLVSAKHEHVVAAIGADPTAKPTEVTPRAEEKGEEQSGRAEEAQQLAAKGAAAAKANPSVDAWHDEQKRRIAEDCDDSLKALRAKKRQKLQDIVDRLRKELDEQELRVQDAKGKVEAEMRDVEREEGHLARAAKKIDLGPYQAAVKKQDDKLKSLRAQVASKKECIKDLEETRTAFDEALAKLRQAKRNVVEAKGIYEDQIDTFKEADAKVPKIQAGVTAAEDEVASAKQRVFEAETKHKKAKCDLREAQTTQADGEATSATTSTTPPPPHLEPEKSHAHRGTAGMRVAAAALVALLAKYASI